MDVYKYDNQQGSKKDKEPPKLDAGTILPEEPARTAAMANSTRGYIHEIEALQL